MPDTKNTFKRRFRWGTLEISFDAGRATMPIFYRTEPYTDFAITPFCTADAKHNRTTAFRLVNEWLASH